jgi:hypothetical protein
MFAGAATFPVWISHGIRVQPLTSLSLQVACSCTRNVYSVTVVHLSSGGANVYLVTVVSSTLRRCTRSLLWRRTR